MCDAQVGFTDPRVLEASPIEVHDPQLRELLGDAAFFSVTFRCGLPLLSTVDNQQRMAFFRCAVNLHMRQQQGCAAARSRVLSPYNLCAPHPPASSCPFGLACRLFKLPGQLEAPPQEDYGQSVTYSGSLPGAAEAYTLDSGHTFPVGESGFGVQ